MQKVYLYQNNTTKDAVGIVFYFGSETVLYYYVLEPSASELLKLIRQGINNPHLSSYPQDKFLDNYTYLMELNVEIDKERA